MIKVLKMLQLFQLFVNYLYLNNFYAGETELDKFWNDLRFMVTMAYSGSDPLF